MVATQSEREPTYLCTRFGGDHPHTTTTEEAKMYRHGLDVLPEDRPEHVVTRLDPDVPGDPPVRESLDTFMHE